MRNADDAHPRPALVETSDVLMRGPLEVFKRERKSASDRRPRSSINPLLANETHASVPLVGCPQPASEINRCHGREQRTEAAVVRL